MIYGIRAETGSASGILSPLDRVLSLLTRNLPILVLLSGLFRAALAVGLWLAFKREYTDDIPFHLYLASDPFGYFLCRDPIVSQQPPLLGAVEMTLLPFVSMLGPFFGPRLAYTVWDLLGSLILVRSLGSRGWDTPLIRLLLFFGPLNVYASVVSAQDETITYCAACACAALLVHGRQGWAFVLACISIVAAKILFVPLAAVLAPFMLNRKHWRFLVAGLAILLLTYSGAPGCHYPVSGFVLPAPHTITVWQLMVDWSGQDWSRSFRVSALLVMMIGGLQYAVASLRWNPLRGSPPKLHAPDPAVAYLLLLLAFLGFFYHVVPEYFLVMIPFLLIFLQRNHVSARVLVGSLGFAIALPIVPDILRYWVRFNIGPDWSREAHQAGCVLVSCLCIACSSALLWAVRREQTA